MKREYDFKGWHITVESEAIGWGGSPRGPVVSAVNGSDKYEITRDGLNGYDGQEHPTRDLPLTVLRKMLREWTVEWRRRQDEEIEAKEEKLTKWFWGNE